MPLIDIIIPSKNNGKWLKTTIDSLLKQTFQDFRIILIDDHSTDNSLNSLTSSKKLLIEKNQGLGLVDALNTGIELSSSEWVARCDGDDINHPVRLAKQLDFALANKLDWVSCQVKSFGHDKYKEGYPKFVRWHNEILNYKEIINYRFKECTMIHPTWFLKSKILKENKYVAGDFPEDYEFLLRNVLNYKSGKVPEVLYYWRDWPGRVSRTAYNFKRDSFLKLKVSYLKLPLNKNIFIIGAGEDGKKLNRYLKSINVIARGFIDLNKNKQNTVINNTFVYSPLDFLNSPYNSQSFCISTVKRYKASENVENWLKKNNFKINYDYVIIN